VVPDEYSTAAVSDCFTATGGGGDAPPADRPLDGPAARQLRAFQAAQNLKADGVAGPRTYMRLSQMSGVDEPRLLAAAPRKP